MLIIIIPTIFLCFIFVYKYRAGNKNSNYSPEWSHSSLIECICWIVPCIIIYALAVMTWKSCYQLDPHRALDSSKKTMTVQVVSLNWKWLFMYPNQGLATINYLEIPVHTPVRFLLTSDAPMNALEIPQLSGQVYSMPGMETQLNIIADKIGVYRGFSANFSGRNFADMDFLVKAVSPEEFVKWSKDIHENSKKLNTKEYIKILDKQESSNVKYFSFEKSENLFNKIILQYGAKGKLLRKTGENNV